MTESDALYIQRLEKELKNLKEQNASQLSMYEMTTVYLKKLQDDLKVSEQKLLQTNKNLTDSINYAKYIQDAFTVQTHSLLKLFPKSFIFQKPKDIVSGDFVWAFDNGRSTYLGLGDCTGHGVPGAMLSIFVISMLNQIVNHFEDETPAAILDKLDKLMLKYLSQYNKQIRDSAELALVKVDREARKLYFSGAKRALIYIRDKQLTSYPGAKYILGNPDRRSEQVRDIVIDLRGQDMIYLFSDGFTDQFGGPKNSKFSTKSLLALLKQVSDSSIEQQYAQIETAYQDWIGKNSQIDDVLLIGIQI